MKTFTNMVDYVKSEMATFSEKPFCEVDSVVLSWLVYLHFEQTKELTASSKGMDIRQAFHAERFDDMLVNVWTPKETIELLGAVVASPRFRNIKMYYYREELDAQSGTQFGAVVYKLLPDLAYVAFRGTDWSIVGWEEDFKLALSGPIPSQKLALDYLRMVAPKFKGRLIIGGHSKGGNLAVYSAAFCSPKLQSRIVNIYSHDGPGFMESELKSAGFKRIKDRILKTVPQDSFFGLIFKEECEYRVVDSNAFAVNQHNPMSWRVTDGDFALQNDVTGAAKLLREKMNTWIDGLSQEDRKKFIDTVFGMLYKTGVKSFDELADDPKKYIPIVMKTIGEMDKETQKFVTHLVKQLIFGGRKVDKNQKEWKDSFLHTIA
ncbi:MAG: DUF2974 domain-containing protein [Lachnospiraceae bacterium]|nr:DUF2974 domain-containing protein [Lachnospiraceae bacterium]